MPDRVNVVPFAPVVTEADWVTCVISGMARAQRRLGGQKALAYTMDLSAKQVGNILAGTSLPAAKRLFDAHAVEGTLLDDVADLYGMRIVPKDSVCSHDASPLSVVTCGLLKKAIDAELDGTETHAELLDMENELRAVQRAVDQRLARIADLRKPRAAA
jgi:hypothetical protein